MEDHRANNAQDLTEILARAQAGDREAVDALCRHYLPTLNRWARGRLPAYARDGIDTEDLVQESVLSALRRLKSFEPRHERAFQAYLRMTIVNRIRDEIRRWTRRAARSRDLPPQASLPSPLEDLLGRELHDRYLKALARLKPSDRDLVVGKIELGLSYEDLARKLHKPSVDSVRMGVRRALERLGREMGAGR